MVGPQAVSFGAMLRGFRGAAKLTQEELAAGAGLSAEAISLLERGVRQTPRMTTVALLADALGLDPAERDAFVRAATRRTRAAELRPHTIDAQIRDSLLASMPLRELPQPGPLPPGSRLLAARNPLFVGRAADLRQIAAALWSGGTAARVPMVAVTGMGGLGKTQLAVEFAHRYGRYFEGGVFWLSFANPEEVPLRIAACGGAGMMELHPAYSDLRLEEQLALVRGAWQSPLPRLLVFDNCEDEQLLAQWRPATGGSRVLATARRANWDPALGVETLPLHPLCRSESIELLRRFRPDLSGEDPFLDRIAQALGDLPLALHLAGRFLDRYRDEVSLLTYLDELRAAPMLEHPSLSLCNVFNPAEPAKPLHGVAQSLTLSYQRLNPHDAVDGIAVTLLARAARLAPGQPLTRELLLRTLGETPRAHTNRVHTDSLARLEALGLLERSHGSYRLHRLLAHFVNGMNPDHEAQHAVDDALIKYGQLAYERRLAGLSLLGVVPHLAHVTNHALRDGEDARAASLSNALGQALHGAGDYTAARPYLERAVRIRERVLGPDHADIASSIDGLAVLLFDSSELAAARPLFERAISIRERALGPDHVDTASSLSNLGTLLQAQGELAKARRLFERALAVTENALGPDHPRTATAVGNLAIVLRDQGDVANARPLFERSLAIRESALGPDHPDTANSLNDLALLLGDLAQRATALSLHERALAIRERVLGPNHARTAQSVNNVARLLREQGELTAARPLFERALRIWETTMGPDHLLTAHALNGLGRLLHQLGELSAARRLHERALGIRERALGPDNSRTAQSLINLATVLQAQGELATARSLLERALTVNQQVFGPDHPRTALALNSLGLLLLDQGEPSSARSCLTRALAIREQALGRTHPDAALSRAALQCLGSPVQPASVHAHSHAPGSSR